ncbi:MAG: LapA family protein [Phycisphaerales bacterium]
MARTKIALVVIAVIVIVVIALQNTTRVDAKSLFFSANVPLAALLLLSFIVGVVASLLVAFALAGKRTAATNDS